jgi:hypothetical protein
VLVFIGSITLIKGISLLAAIAEDLAKDFLIVVAGKASPDADADVQLLIDAGAIVENRRISEREIEALYRVADMVWCCYRPDYDQASGIFGRAAQFGRSAVVREGAMIAQYDKLAPISIVPIPWDSPDKAVRRIRAGTGHIAMQADAPSSAMAWRADFRKRIADAL